MKKKAVIILAEGFEEMEAVIPIDLLRRSGVEVTVAGLNDLIVKGSRGIMIQTDCLLEAHAEHADALILPGGGKGAENLAMSEKVKKIILEMHSQGRIIAAICASPSVVLSPLGILSQKKATCFPECAELFEKDISYCDKSVVVDGNIITSKAAGTAFEFALTLVRALLGQEKAQAVSASIHYSFRF